MMKAVGYVRVSTLEQAEEGTSLDTQRAEIQKYANDPNIPIYEDRGVSGTRSDRPGLMRLLEEAREKKFEMVIVNHLDRFGRSNLDLLNNIHTLKEHGIKFASIQNRIDTSDDTGSGELLLHVLSAVAQFEHRMIKERMGSGKTAKWRDGRTVVGSLPFGYKRNKENKAIIEVDPTEKEIYNRIVSMYLDQGLSFKAIEERLNREGVKCGKKPWSSATISYVLKNPYYHGRSIVNQTRYEGKRRTKDKKPAKDHIPLENKNRFIFKTRWNQIQERTAFNKAKGKHISISDGYFLRDILICGECGGAVKPRHGNKRKDGSRPRYYSCFWSGTSDRELKSKGRKRCSLPYLPADEIEEWVWYGVVSFLSLQRIERKGFPPSPFNDLFDAKRYEKQLAQLQQQMAETEREIKRKELAKERLSDLLEEPKFNQDDFFRMKQKFDDEISTLTSRREDINMRIEELGEAEKRNHQYRDFLTNKRGFLKRMVDGLLDLSAQDRKRLVEGMVRDKVRIWKGYDLEPWEAETPKLRFNREILSTFMSEGKLPYSDKATPHYFA